jgi:hypothetical protein
VTYPVIGNAPWLPSGPNPIMFDEEPAITQVGPWPATPIPIALPVSAGAAIIVGGPVQLWGWALRESTGAAPAAVDLFSGTNTTGLLVAPINLLANESTREGPWTVPIQCNGLAMNVRAGAVTGVVYVVPQ